MAIQFYKYHGTGNDFIIIDNRSDFFPKKEEALIEKMCNRRFGVGADGLILLENSMTTDFKMVYFNADGKEGSMCGNGGRCIAHFANTLGIGVNPTTFEATDGLHQAIVNDHLVRLKMNDVSQIQVQQDTVFLDTGSPHHVTWVTDIKGVLVEKEGSDIRYNTYGEEGANVNFVEQLKTDKVSVRTYERGVEAETFSCGTGVTAVALALFETGKTNANSIDIYTRGGDLNVSFTKENGVYKNIFLSGPATLVFKGEWI